MFLAVLLALALAWILCRPPIGTTGGFGSLALPPSSASCVPPPSPEPNPFPKPKPKPKPPKSCKVLSGAAAKSASKKKSKAAKSKAAKLKAHKKHSAVLKSKFG